MYVTRCHAVSVTTTLEEIDKLITIGVWASWLTSKKLRQTFMIVCTVQRCLFGTFFEKFDHEISAFNGLLKYFVRFEEDIIYKQQ